MMKNPIIMLLKPSPFKVRSMGDLEQLLQNFVDYFKHMDKFFTTTAVLGAHTAEHVHCNTCMRAKVQGSR